MAEQGVRKRGMSNPCSFFVCLSGVSCPHLCLVLRVGGQCRGWMKEKKEGATHGGRNTLPSLTKALGDGINKQSLHNHITPYHNTNKERRAQSTRAEPFVCYQMTKQQYNNNIPQGPCPGLIVAEVAEVAEEISMAVTNRKLEERERERERERDGWRCRYWSSGEIAG